MLNKVLIIILSITAIASCGGNSNQTSPLEGTWAEACNSLGDYFVNTKVTFSGNTSSTSSEIYTDSNCTESSESTILKGTVLIGEAVATSDGITATELDFTATEFNGSPYDDKSYDIFYIENNILYSGKEDNINDGTTESLRPVSLDFTREFIKQ